jgi:hypothetical protein
VFDSKPRVSSASPGRLDFICYKQAAVLARYFNGAFEITRWWNDETADSENWLRHECGDLASGGCHNQFFNVVSAGETTFRIAQFERTTIAVRRTRMNKAGNLGRQWPPGSMAHSRKGSGGASAITVPQHDNFVAAGG